jgi:hypothetical protein
MLKNINRTQNLFTRPTWSTGDNLRPDLLGHTVVLAKQTPVRTRLWLDPFEVFDEAPAVVGVEAVVVEGLLF